MLYMTKQKTKLPPAGIHGISCSLLGFLQTLRNLTDSPQQTKTPPAQTPLNSPTARHTQHSRHPYTFSRRLIEATEEAAGVLPAVGGDPGVREGLRVAAGAAARSGVGDGERGPGAK